jgi:hypothetical protein
MRYEKAREGLWCSSSDEETWCCYDFFDTREEAIKHAEMQEHTYIGQVGETSTLGLFANFASQVLVDQLDEHVCEQDEWRWREDTFVKTEPSKEALVELNTSLSGWFSKHDVFEESWYVNLIEDLGSITR